MWLALRSPPLNLVASLHCMWLEVRMTARAKRNERNSRFFLSYLLMRVPLSATDFQGRADSDNESCGIKRTGRQLTLTQDLPLFHS